MAENITSTLCFSLVLCLLPLRRGERLQLQAGLVDVKNREAEKGVPHLIRATQARTATSDGGLSGTADDSPLPQPLFVQTHTLKSKSASEKFLCSAGDRNCVVTTMMLQKANINAVGRLNEVAAKNR